jgi:D-alanyl-D-alanine dipeptidase
MRGLCAVFVGLLLCQCAGDPSTKKGFVPGDVRLRAAPRALVEVRQVVPDALVDMRYITKKNVTYQGLYPGPMPCLMHITTARKLAVAAEILRPQGYRLKIWDAWRPPEVQVSLYEHGGRTGMFADPSVVWSRHCSGTAVDLTLTDLKGRELRMPTGFDEGGPLSYYLYTGRDPEIRRNITALQQAMVRAGFTMLDTEWWHFDDADYNNTTPPPVVFASELGIHLPRIQKPRR